MCHNTIVLIGSRKLKAEMEALKAGQFDNKIKDMWEELQRLVSQTINWKYKYILPVRSSPHPSCFSAEHLFY